MGKIYGETGMVPVTGRERPMLRPEAASTEARFESASLHQTASMRKVITSFVFPPIPIRSHDWCAYFDDLGADCSPYGWGRTEAEAKQDLLDNQEDEI